MILIISGCCLVSFMINCKRSSARESSFKESSLSINFSTRRESSIENIFMSVDSIFQRRAVLSLDPVKAKVPSELKVTEFTQSECPISSRLVGGDLVRSQRRAVRSYDPVKAHRPLGLKATDTTKLVCPVNTWLVIGIFVRSQKAGGMVVRSGQ